MILRPKNWHNFQHYKDRNPPWIKLHKSLLDDFEFQCLPTASRALAPMLWLLASESLDGEICAEVDKISFRLRMLSDEFIEALKPLIKQGFIVDASAVLAPCYPNAMPETETETETEKRQNGAAPPASLVPLEKLSRKSRKREKLGTFHPEVVAMIARLMEVWPTVRDGKTFTNDDVRAAGNAQLILDTTDATVEKLEAAAMAWLATNPTFPNAIQFWFGTSAKAPWRPEVMNLNLQKVHA